MARLTILTQDEINALYAIPSLDDEERTFLFSLDVEDRAIIDTLGNDTARKVDYILQLGYYRAIGYFFLFSFLSGLCPIPALMMGLITRFMKSSVSQVLAIF